MSQSEVWVAIAILTPIAIYLWKDVLIDPRVSNESKRATEWTTFGLVDSFTYISGNPWMMWVIIVLVLLLIIVTKLT